ncbi:MAG: hypothetical protein KC468_00075 [Myxococcales bacterium]|nr:hypothetical protein [Myxococcales bacterium]
MNLSSAVTHALPVPTNSGKAGASAPLLDMREVQAELDELAHEVVRARELGVPLPEAVRSPEFPNLSAFHQGLRDALFVEIPRDFEPLVAPLTGAADSPVPAEQLQSLAQLQRTLVEHAQAHEVVDVDEHEDELETLQSALAELLVFESVRLRLLITTLSTEDYELVGGEETDIDAIAWREIEFLLHEPAIRDPQIRPLSVMHAAATVAVARDAADRADLLRASGEDFREELRMRARLRAALRELRLPESVLLENALASLLGNERKELTTLQSERPVALEGLSRQAMDQRVSRGRRALTRQQTAWPRRRRPALFDLLRQPSAA